MQVGPRHFFQHGALGGATKEEFLHGGERVAQYLERYGSKRRSWDSPVPDTERPEAEWGFEPQLLADIEDLARRRGYRVRPVRFADPEEPSAFVAELYRRWYDKHGSRTRRLLVESFILSSPYWAVRTGSIPFWMTFNKQPSADNLEQYLKHTDPYDEIYMMIFSHGVESIRLVPVSRWRELAARATGRHALLGMTEQHYPRHFSTLARYYHDLQRQIPERQSLLPPLELDELDAFVAEHGRRFAVEFQEGGGSPSPQAHMPAQQ